MTVNRRMPAGARFRREKYLIILVLPTLIYFFVFNYIPMAGTLIAFTDYYPGIPIWSAPFAGLRWFSEFFNSMFFTRLLGNTVTLSGLMILFGFPIPIAFALLLNEMRDGVFKKTVQTISYLPHFISTVVLVGILKNLLAPTDGVVNLLITRLGGKSINFLAEANWFRPLYVISGIWQEFGWNSILYFAALTAIDSQQYEAARIDGCGRWGMLIHITLPGLRPTMITLLILTLGNIMNVGFEKVLLMYSPTTMKVGDVFSTYVYTRGVQSMQYSLGAAVGLFNSALNLCVLLIVNFLSRKYTETSLW